MNQILAEVISNSEIMPDVFLTWLKAPVIASEAKPGQFVMVNCGEDTLLPRPLSIYQYGDGKIALLSRIIGTGTKWLSERKTTETLSLFGPLGNGFSISQDSKNILLVAGGMGIAPICSFASSLDMDKYSVRIILGAPTTNQLYPDEYLPSSPKIEIINITEDGTSEKKGVVTDYIGDHIDWADQIFACGPLGMYKTMSRIPELQKKSVQVSLEVRMACGRGICYGCTIKTKQGLRRVCEHGPVFEMSDILWDEISTLL